jgi:tetratricopeptide (TPR) repeat protein
VTARVVVCAWWLAATAVAAQAPTAIADADEAMRLGRFDRAASQYEAWLATHPNAYEVLLALGASYIQLGRTRDAVAVLERYVARVPDSASGHAALGIALLDVASMADARRALDRALAINPDQVNAREALARVHMVEGRPAAATALLAPLVEKGAEVTDDTKQLYAESLIRSGDAPAAARLLGAEIAADPQRPIQTYALACLANIAAAAGAGTTVPAYDRAYDNASAVCEQGMRLYPDSEIEGVYLSLPPAVLAARTAARLAALQQARDVREMIALGRVLTDVDPTRQTRAAEIARQLLADSVAAAPDNASARYNYGRALRRSDLRGALAQWEQALTLQPADDLRMQVLTQIARTKDDSSDVTGAEAAFREALALNRRLPRRVAESALEYVRFLQRQARPAEAAALVDEVVAWNPWAPEARVEKARLLADAGKWPEVVAEGEFVLANAGGGRSLERAAHLLLARAYYRMQQPDRALAHRTWLEAKQ